MLSYRSGIRSVCACPSFLLLFGCYFAAPAAQGRSEEAARSAASIAELRQHLEKILLETHTPGLSVAIVHRNGAEWVAGLGKSSIAANQAATDETLFRVVPCPRRLSRFLSSSWRMRASYRLLDPVRTLVPEIWFENQWEATNPVLVADLLEHTTGWDDMHLREYAKDAKGMTVRQGLDYYRDHGFPAGDRERAWPTATLGPPWPHTLWRRSPACASRNMSHKIYFCLSA